MLLFVVRHGDPVYNPDSLTERGKLQAKALAKRLALYGVDKLYSSPLIRAQQTAEPTEILLNKKLEIEEWTSENLAWQDFAVKQDSGMTWIFHSRLKNAIKSPEVLALGKNWYDADVFSGTNAKAGYHRILDASDEFLARHGYVHDRENLNYIAKQPNDERIAVFCHQGFGLSWLGTLLDIPLPLFWTTMDLSHSSMTAIEFSANEQGICLPKVLTLSNDSHIYREGLPTKYNNYLYF